MRFDGSFPIFSHIVKNVYLTGILSILSLGLFGQGWPEIHWLDDDSETLNSIHADSTLRVWNGEFWETTDTLTFQGLSATAFNGIDRLKLIPNSNPMHFVAQGTQQVYIFNKAQKKFFRYDATYHRGYNFNSIKWFRNDTLFSLGGYGFWHTHSILSYYSSDSKEWHVIPTIDGPMNVTNDYYQFSKDGKQLYITYSSIINGSDVEHDLNVWKLNLTSFTWEDLGKLKSDALDAVKTANRRLHLPIGTIIGNGQNRLLDLENNRIDYLESSVIDLRFHSNNTFSKGLGAIVGSDYYLNFQVPGSSSLGKSVSLKYAFDKILTSRRNPEKIYYSGWPIWIWVAIGAAGVFTLWGLYLLFRKLRQPFLKGTTVEAEELFFKTLEKQEVTLLKALLRSEMRGEGLKSEPITQIMGWQRKSWDNQRKWRNNLIKELNQRAEENLNIEELIYREKDPHDKRERVYRLNGDGFRLLRNSIHFS